nr:hypothetical protein [Tanacetum cinerariifolium]
MVIGADVSHPKMGAGQALLLLRVLSGVRVQADNGQYKRTRKIREITKETCSAVRIVDMPTGVNMIEFYQSKYNICLENIQALDVSIEESRKAYWPMEDQVGSSFTDVRVVKDFSKKFYNSIERAEVYYECKEPLKSLKCLWVMSKSIAAIWLEKVVTPLIDPAVKGFAAASAALKPERLKIDKHCMSGPMSYYLID